MSTGLRSTEEKQTDRQLMIRGWWLYYCRLLLLDDSLLRPPVDWIHYTLQRQQRHAQTHPNTSKCMEPQTFLIQSTERAQSRLHVQIRKIRRRIVMMNVISQQGDRTYCLTVSTEDTGYLKLFCCSPHHREISFIFNHQAQAPSGLLTSRLRTLSNISGKLSQQNS